MIISSLVAMNGNKLIGVNNDLPWKLKDDLEHFKNYSMHKPIIMGRNTYDSIGRPLPNRTNIIVQEFINFPVELGIFYIRYPDKEHGHITSVVKKELLVVTGNGINNVEELMKRNSKITISVEGHADERGTREYNLALGQRRAESVANYLIANGINRDRLITKSYGEERPLSLGSNNAAWSKNRRVEIK